jgi:hypothetical protein
VVEPATISEAAAPIQDGGLTRDQERQTVAALAVTQPAFAVIVHRVPASRHQAANRGNG